MVVDDEAALTTHLDERLTWMGYEVVGRASSGVESINKAKRLKPDVILMDIVMPGKLDGIDASKKIKEDLDIPVIFLTAYADDKFVKRAKDAYPFGYLIKPANPDEIKATIEVALHKKDMERRLNKLLDKYRSLVNNINYATISVDSNKNITFWNNGAESIFGYTANEALGKPLIFILPERIREEYEKDMNRMVLRRKSSVIGKVIEIFGLRKDGSEFPFEHSLAFWKVNKVSLFTCIGRDITERKQVDEERERIFMQSLQSEKMSGVSTLADGIAHEFNNILQIMSGHIELAKITKEPEDIEEALDIVLKNAERAAKIVKNLFAFSKQKVSGKELCNITEFLESTLLLTEAKLKEQNISVVRKYKKTSKVKVNKAEMQHVFLNMVTNAGDAIVPKSGTIEIGVSQVGKNVEVSFCDTGRGMKKKELIRIFEPFYTTRETIGGEQDATPGTGLGLSVSYGIVQRDGGTIEVESEVGIGTTFTVKLPAKKAKLDSNKGKKKEVK